jgi:hypothetical protein
MNGFRAHAEHFGRILCRRLSVVDSALLWQVLKCFLFMLNGMKNKSFFCAAIVILVLYLPLDNNFET